jgi:serine/threonine protein kinase
MVAIKTIPNVFGHVEDAKRTLREIKLLRHFNHKNITSIRDTILPDSYASFDKVVLVEEYMETDMHQIIQSKQQLTDEHYQYFLYQVLRGLKALHSADVLHRDLKPGNLLVNSDCLTQICDFGLARVVADQDEGLLTEYVVTRWYRPPEVCSVGRCAGLTHSACPPVASQCSLSTVFLLCSRLVLSQSRVTTAHAVPSGLLHQGH